VSPTSNVCAVGSKSSIKLLVEPLVRTSGVV
jgi:hypothetical protein